MFKKLLKFFNPLSIQKEVFEKNVEEGERHREINRAVAMLKDLSLFLKNMAVTRTSLNGKRLGRF